MYTVFGMTRRREICNEKLAALRQRLSAMTLHDLESFYKATHNACRYTETRAPAPAVVQEFVQAWKQLRRVKRRF
jgi:predicted nucleotidyltransferase component of viral defense system